MIRTKTKEKSLATLTKELDEVFSLFIRLRDSDNNGTVTCFVTGERVFWKDCDAAHWIHRSQMATRWDEENVHSTTRDTNRYEDPYEHERRYTNAMKKLYGKEICESLKRQSKSLAKYTRPELISGIEHYKLEVAKLKMEKGL